MKRLIIILLCSYTALLPALAQQNTELGYIIPTSDTIRVLMVFAEVEYDTTPGACTKSPPPCPGYNAWGTDSTGKTVVPDGADTIFDYSSSVGGFPSGYITDYYHQASLGNYVVLGDYLPFVVTVSCSSMTASSLNVTPVVNVINNDTSLPATLLSANGLELEDFDLFDWNPGPSNYGKSKPKGKDGQIDMMFIVWRNNQYLNSEIQSSCLGCQSGYGLTTASSPTLKGYGPFTCNLLNNSMLIDHFLICHPYK